MKKNRFCQALYKDSCDFEAGPEKDQNHIFF